MLRKLCCPLGVALAIIKQFADGDTPLFQPLPQLLQVFADVIGGTIVREEKPLRPLLN